MFFYLNDSNSDNKHEKIVNLANVTNIAFLENEHRVVFNLSYACSMTSMGNKNETSQLADYIYWDTYTDEDLERLKNNSYIKENFFGFPNYPRIINKNHVASIKFDSRADATRKKKPRVIINIACSIRLKPDSLLSSDFLFVNAETMEQFEEYKRLVLDMI